MDNEVKITIPTGKKAVITLRKSGYATYQNSIWVVHSCKNVMGILPGTMVPEQDLDHFHNIPDLDIIIEENPNNK